MAKKALSLDSLAESVSRGWGVARAIGVILAAVACAGWYCRSVLADVDHRQTVTETTQAAQQKELDGVKEEIHEIHTDVRDLVDALLPSSKR